MNSRVRPCSPPVRLAAATCALASALLGVWPQPAQADLPDLEGTLQTDAERLAAVTSDEEARTFFSVRVVKTLPLEPLLTSPEAKKSSGQPRFDTREFTETAVKLVADLAAWRLATVLGQVPDSTAASTDQEAVQREARHRTWVLAKSQGTALRQATALHAALAALPDQSPPASKPPQGYEAYAAYLDRTYPRLVGPAPSWSGTAEQEGVAGLRHRLDEYWNGQPAPGDATRQEFMTRYVAARLRPALAGHLLSLSRQAQAEAERDALRDWVMLRDWTERAKTSQGLARLCGTWQWTIHNHQNHQDLKTVIVFPPEGTGTPPGAVPQKILILGEAVYLRWEFRGGLQEDSLLFAGGGQRLEGTFVNSAGAWGNVTGKRTGACGQ